MNDTTPADEQIGYLRRAALAWGEHLDANPGLLPDPRDEDAGTPVTDALAKAEHLAACFAAVDAMCCGGILPTDWRPRYGNGRTEAEEKADDSRMISEGMQLAFPPLPDPRVTANGGAVGIEECGPPAECSCWPDPRVTANGGAAAKAGWDLAASEQKLLGPARVELMGHRVRVGMVSAVTMLGAQFLRIDFPQDDEDAAPEFYRYPEAVYGIMPGDLPSPGAQPRMRAEDYGDQYRDDPS